MEDDSNANNTSRSGSSFQDAQGNWYSNLTSPDPSILTTTVTSMTSATTPSNQEQSQHEVLVSQSGTICVSSDDDDSGTKEQEQLTSILSQEWLPPAASTPLFAAATNTPRSEREMENDLFNDIQKLV